MRKTLLMMSAACGAAAVVGLGVAPALAAGGGSVTANLAPVVGSGVTGSGTAMVSWSGGDITVMLAATGLLPNQFHGAQIHVGADARHACPSLSDDISKDGHLTMTEGIPAYGDVAVSLTTSGDTGPWSAEAATRFGTAPGGKLTYERAAIPVTADVAAAIAAGQAVLVVDGVDYNHDGKYSGDTKSDVDPTLPAEATAPALCGVLSAAPFGGMATGQGGAAGGQNQAMLLVGGVSLLAAAGSGAFAVRRRTRG